jgi:hypothetical protein
MFILQPKWLQSVYDYLLEWIMPEKFTTSQTQYLAQPFVLQDGIFYRFGQNNKFHRALRPEHVLIILQELHSGARRRHFSSNIIVRKVLDASYWWPTMSKDVHEFCQICDLCQ